MEESGNYKECTFQFLYLCGIHTLYIATKASDLEKGLDFDNLDPQQYFDQMKAKKPYILITTRVPN